MSGMPRHKSEDSTGTFFKPESNQYPNGNHSCNVFFLSSSDMFGYFLRLSLSVKIIHVCALYL